MLLPFQGFTETTTIRHTVNVLYIAFDKMNVENA